MPVPIRIIIIALVLTLTGVTGQPALATASDPGVLGIFGNANGDHAIDMRDVTCIEQIIQGLRPPGSLADARYDNRVDTLDVTLTQQIILGNEPAITLLDETGSPLTVSMPVRRVIPEHITSLEAVRVVGATQKLVSIGSTAVKTSMGPVYLQNLAGLPTIGAYAQPDHEAILSLNPDLVIAYRCRILKEKLPGVALFYGGYGEPYPPEYLETDMIKLGYLLDKREKARAYVDWYTGYLDMIKGRVAPLSEDEKPKVYVFYPLTGLYKCRGNYPPVQIAGGINIGSNLGPGFAVDVDPEWVIAQNPDVMISTVIPDKGAYETDDLSKMAAQRDSILNRPELAGVSAVKKGKVYCLNTYALGLFPNYILSIAYYAKWFHPDLFKDLDPRAVHQEYLDRFQQMDFQVNAHGVFVYPPPKPLPLNPGL